MDNPTASFLLGDTADRQPVESTKESPQKVSIPPGYVDAHFIDEGGMGKVFRALELSTGRTVAIKMLHAHKMSPELVARFAIEAKSLAAMNHENVVVLHEFQNRANPPYLVMEYVDGTSAFELVKTKTKLDIKEAVDIIKQAATGAHAAHQRGVIHRDIKPSNILINTAGVVKLTDFGLAKRIHRNDQLTEYDYLAGGSPGYMSPEHLKPKLGACSEATDVWCLGATLYCLLTGQPPYPASKSELIAVFDRNHKSVRELRSEVSLVLDAIVQKCLAFEQANRYDSAKALATDLDNYTHRRPTIVRPPSWVGRRWHTIRSLQTATVVAWSMALLVIMIIGASFLNRRDLKPIIITDETLRQAYYEDCRKQLRDGKTVTLIGDDGTGPPKHVEWPLMAYQFTKPYDRPLGATQLTAKHHCFAQLLDDPGIDSYILRGEFLHLGAAMIDTAKFNGAMPFVSVVGLGFGLHRLKRVSGLESDNFMTFTYQDGWPFEDPNATKTMHLATLVVHDVRHGENFNGSSYKSTSHFAAMEYQPTERPKQLWRELEVRITPDDLMPSMTVTNGVMGTMHNRYPTSRSKQYLKMVKSTMAKLPQFPNDSYMKLEWSPKRPVGIWCQQSTVAVRNVQIIPTQQTTD